METFNHLLNWKLKRGSHEFPGSDGGTCINEAAIVVAGFKYRQIGAVEQMPACFSRPICRFAMQLNDQAHEEERQKLLPFVTRLACADAPMIEARRAAYIFWHTHSYFPRVPFEMGLKVLEGALATGRQADPLGPEEVRGRMEEAKTTTTMAVLHRLPSAQVKSWLAMKESEPAA